MILQVRSHVVIATQDAHDKDTALNRIRLDKQNAVLQHLETKSQWGAIQGDDINWLLQSDFEHGADFRCVRENRLV